MQQRCAASPYIRNGNSVQTVTSTPMEAINTTNKAYLAAIEGPPKPEQSTCPITGLDSKNCLLPRYQSSYSIQNQ